MGTVPPPGLGRSRSQMVSSTSPSPHSEVQLSLRTQLGHEGLLLGPGRIWLNTWGRTTEKPWKKHEKPDTNEKTKKTKKKKHGKHTSLSHEYCHKLGCFLWLEGRRSHQPMWPNKTMQKHMSIPCSSHIYPLLSDV